MSQKVTLKGEDLGEFDYPSLTLKDLFAIKAQTGMGGLQWAQAIGEGDPLALQCLVWFQLMKQGRPVDMASIDFAISDLVLTEVKTPDPNPSTSSEQSETAISELSGTSSDSAPLTLTH